MTTLEALEFDRIRSALGEYGCTADGIRRLETLEPEANWNAVREARREVREVMRVIDAGVPVPSGAVPPVERVFSVLNHKGEVLELEDFVALRALLSTAGEFVRFFRAGEEEELVSPVRSAALKPPVELMQTLRRLITGEGRLNEDAIPEIASLRRHVTDLHQDLRRFSDEIIRSNRDMYREDVATVRDGRTVLPLVAGFRGRLDGIVHEASGSGETLFVEPRELVDLNNELVSTRNEILREIRRVLRETTERARMLLHELEPLRTNLVHADTVVARARYGGDLKGLIVPEGETVHLKEARHPLLGSRCVPVDITFDPGIRLLVLSGPNTGGKTVLLKTLGLLSVMNQCGIPVPVREGSHLPLFSWIGVDIGDEQSIDQALSTFSAHLRNLGEITRRADERSLVLLDELGSGTDPEEGAALSLAIVDHLVNNGATVLVTTHQTVLKHYGYTREYAANAAMAFDDEEHRPTYRVIPGRPGVSHAIEAALEQGLLPEIVARARGYHKDTHGGVSTIISRLLEQEDQLRVREEALAERESALQSEHARTEAARRSLEEREERLKREGLAELNRALREARSRVEQEIRALRERDVPLGREEIQAAHEPIRALEQLRRVVDHDTSSAGVPPGELRPGMSVRHRTTGRTGTVRSIRGTQAEVRFGAVRMTVSAQDLVPGDEETHRAGSFSYTTEATASESGTSGTPPKMEIDLRGYRLEEALEALERHVDAAVQHNLSFFGVIHGTGTGVLQKGVQDYLRRRREVRTVQFARPEDGGFGKTVVELQ